MILSDKDIKKLINDGQIVFKPRIDFKKQLGSCSIDLRLGNYFRVFNYSQVTCFDPFIRPANNNITKEVKVKNGRAFILHPHDFVLAVSIEEFSLPNDLLARLEGRSSLGRMGIVVHSTASIFDPGWRGKVVMELGNFGKLPVALYPGMRICALTFEQVTTPVEVPYYKKKGAKYLDQIRPEASKIEKDKNL